MNLLDLGTTQGMLNLFPEIALIIIYVGNRK